MVSASSQEIIIECVWRPDTFYSCMPQNISDNSLCDLSWYCFSCYCSLLYFKQQYTGQNNAVNPYLQAGTVYKAKFKTENILTWNSQKGAIFGKIFISHCLYTVASNANVAHSTSCIKYSSRALKHLKVFFVFNNLFSIIILLGINDWLGIDFSCVFLVFFLTFYIRIFSMVMELRKNICWHTNL